MPGQLYNTTFLAAFAAKGSFLQRFRHNAAVAAVFFYSLMANTIIMYSIPNYSQPVNIGGHLFGNRVEATFNGDTFPQGKEFSDGQFDFVSKLGNDWQKGHLLGVRFGGIADERNFLPMTQKANLAFKAEMEDKLKKIIDSYVPLNSFLYEKTNKYCYIHYSVGAYIWKTIRVNGIEIPPSFMAKVQIIDYMGKAFDDNLLNDFFNDNINDDVPPITFPLFRVFRTNL